MTRVVDATSDPIGPDVIAAAVEALREGDIVALPTDTVYGLAADPWRSGAVDRLFRVGRGDRPPPARPALLDRIECGGPSARRRAMERTCPLR